MGWAGAIGPNPRLKRPIQSWGQSRYSPADQIILLIAIKNEKHNNNNNKL